ncbi:MAG: hypothetical protein HDS69_04155 [Bacteroidales bacterium]|nr:hypothetical protein [Bacteroidales bacterium]MBD5258407.1 hypothetical protein [Barnesiella sp.]
MKQIIYTLTILLAAMMLPAGCGSRVNPDQNIEIARTAIAEGDYTSALSALDEANSVLRDSTASPKALAQIAVLYCIIDENNHTENNQYKAIECYELAMKISPDSVKECFGLLSDNEQMALDLLGKLHNASRDISEFAEPLDGTEYGDSLQIINDIDIME